MNGYVIVRTNELYHEGVDGMKWGQQNGPPYPLRPSQMSPREIRLNRNEGFFKRKKRLAEQKKEQKAYEKAERKAEKQAIKEKKEKANRLKKNLRKAELKYGINQKKKNDIIRSADIEKAFKYKEAFTSRELEDILKRNDMQMRLKQEVTNLKQRDIETGIRKVQSLGRFLNGAADIGRAGVDVYNIITATSNALNGTNRRLIDTNPGNQKNKNSNDNKGGNQNNNNQNQGGGKTEYLTVHNYNAPAVDRRVINSNNTQTSTNLSDNRRVSFDLSDRSSNTTNNNSFSFNNTNDNRSYTQNNRNTYNSSSSSSASGWASSAKSGSSYVNKNYSSTPVSSLPSPSSNEVMAAKDWMFDQYGKKHYYYGNGIWS